MPKRIEGSLKPGRYGIERRCEKCRRWKTERTNFKHETDICDSCAGFPNQKETGMKTKVRATDNVNSSQAVLPGDGMTECPYCGERVMRRSLWVLGDHRCGGGNE